MDQLPTILVFDCPFSQDFQLLEWLLSRMSISFRKVLLINWHKKSEPNSLFMQKIQTLPFIKKQLQLKFGQIHLKKRYLPPTKTPDFMAHRPSLSLPTLEQNYFESNWSLNGFRGCHENALIKRFLMGHHSRASNWASHFEAHEEGVIMALFDSCCSLVEF